MKTTIHKFILEKMIALFLQRTCNCGETNQGKLFTSYHFIIVDISDVYGVRTFEIE